MFFFLLFSVFFASVDRGQVGRARWYRSGEEQLTRCGWGKVVTNLEKVEFFKKLNFLGHSSFSFSLGSC